MKKNKIYVNKITKKINNNQKECVLSKYKNENNIKETVHKKSVGEVLDSLLKGNGYLFSTKVKIITKDKEYDTLIAGKINDHLITIDNDIININDIKDLIIK